MNSAYRLTGIVYAYAKEPVIDIDELAIASGKITVLLGRNGAGKSTLLNLLAFLLEPALGQICFYRTRVRANNRRSSRRRIGLVQQRPYLLSGTVLANVELGLRLRGISRRQRRVNALDALRSVAMEDYADSQANQLSGGEIQKVALARALALEPDVLLFDEPFTYLDRASIELVQEIIRKFAGQSGRSVVFSTHDVLQGIALADDVKSLRDGRLAEIPPVNIFNGRISQGYFDTGKIKILLPGDNLEGAHAAVDPNEIVLSNGPLRSSLRNSYEGRVVSISEDDGAARVVADTGETIQALITPKSLAELGLAPGVSVWVSFKSTALKVF